MGEKVGTVEQLKFRLFQKSFLLQISVITSLPLMLDCQCLMVL